MTKMLDRSLEQAAAMRKEWKRSSVVYQPEYKVIRERLRQVKSMSHCFGPDLICSRHGCNMDWAKHQKRRRKCEGHTKMNVWQSGDKPDQELYMDRVDARHGRTGEGA